MIIIDDKQFTQASLNIDFKTMANSELLDAPIIGNALKRYLLLTNCAEKFRYLNFSDIYYNRYYWFVKFLVAYQNSNGHDAGLEQQELKILEEGENIPDIDWGIIEKIAEDIK